MALDIDALFEIADSGCYVDNVAHKGGIVERLRYEDAIDFPIELTDHDNWERFVNKDLYDMEIKVREFLEGIEWRKLKKGKPFRCDARLVFEWIFGRKPTQSDQMAFRYIHRLLAYYCSEYTEKTTFMGRVVPHVYYFNATASRVKYRHTRMCRRPYSLKLRLEWAKERADAKGEEVDLSKVFRADSTRDKHKLTPRLKNRANGADADEGSGESGRASSSEDNVAEGDE